MPDLKILAAIALSIIAAATYGYVTLVEKPKPVLDANIELSGIESEVEIIRDSFGVPHIYADSEADMFFAQGFVHAQDRLWQMELNRYVGQGRLAELFGEVALESDVAIRTLGIHRAVDNYYEMASEQSKSRLEAYVAGINAYLGSELYRKPVECVILGHTPEPWEARDVFATLGAMAIDLQSHFVTIYERSLAQAELEPALYALITQPYSALGTFVIDSGGQGVVAGEPNSNTLLQTSHSVTSKSALAQLRAFNEKLDFLRDLEILGTEFGSNNWAVHGSLTDTGLPYLANDPHLSSRQPATWYENHLNSPDFYVSGATLAGIPGVIIGHNQDIAWGVTVTYLAMQDLYIERLNPDDATQYEYEGEWRNLEVVSEEFFVRGREEPEIVEIYRTHHGPIVSENLEADETLALAWVFTQPPEIDAIAAVFDLNQASNWTEFRAAISHWIQDLNFVYADVNNNIGYQMSGRLPNRPQLYQGLPVAGWTGEHDWNGLRDFDALPHVLNPATGFVATANSRVVSNDLYDEIAAEWSVPFRSVRLIDLLQKRGEFTLESMRRIQSDSYAQMYLNIRQLMVELIEPKNRFERRVLEQVDGWHGVVHEQGIGPVILDQMTHEIVDVVFNRRLDEISEYIDVSNGMYYFWELARRTANHDWYDDPETAEIENLSHVMRTSFENALKSLTQDIGPDVTEWTWEQARPELFDHALGGLPLIGSLFNVTSPTAGGRFTLNRDTTSYRFIADLSDWGNSLSSSTTGQSGHPFSDHYDDQIEYWRFVTPRPMAWTRAEVEAAQQHLITLRPSEED